MFVFIHKLPMQWKQLTAAKEKVCHYVLGNEFSYQWMELREYRDDLPTIQHRMNVSIAAVIAPMLYYYPHMIPRHNSAINYRQFAHSVLGTDYLTDEFMRQSLFYSYTRRVRDCWKRNRHGRRHRRIIQMLQLQGGSGSAATAASAARNL